MSVKIMLLIDNLFSYRILYYPMPFDKEVVDTKISSATLKLEEVNGKKLWFNARDICGQK